MIVFLLGILIGLVCGGLAVAFLVAGFERDSRRADVLDFTGVRDIDVRGNDQFGV
jgi:hypothetical protein